MWLESKTVNLFLPNFYDHSKLIPLNFFYLVLLLSLTLSLPRFSTSCCTILMMLVLRNGVGSMNNPPIDSFHFFP